MTEKEAIDELTRRKQFLDWNPERCEISGGVPTQIEALEMAIMAIGRLEVAKALAYRIDGATRYYSEPDGCEIIALSDVFAREIAKKLRGE